MSQLTSRLPRKILPALNRLKNVRRTAREQTSSSVNRVAVPVARAAHQAELAQDSLLVLVLPGPDPLDQGVAAQVVAGLLLLLEQPLLDDGLGGDAGVVGAGHPEAVVALHPPPADQDVLQRVVERMAQVQAPGDVRRRDHDAVAGFRSLVGSAWK